MATTPTFINPEGRSHDRKLLVTCINTGTKESPEWSLLGYKTPKDGANISQDMSAETSKDVLGNTFTDISDNGMSQTFEPLQLIKGQAGVEHIHNLAFRLHDTAALSNQDVLLVHDYASPAFAERYPNSAVVVTSLGGENLGMSVEVRFGGQRTEGAVSRADGKIEFTAVSEGTANEE